MSTLLNLSKNPNDPTLFLGEELGLSDYIQMAHPQLNELTLLQRSQYWIETEVLMSNDRKQWNTIHPNFQRITLDNLSWQTMTDTFVSRAPEQVLAPLVSRPELESMIKWWSIFEEIHSRAYSNIIQNVVPLPEDYIANIMRDFTALGRIEDTIKFFDELNVLSLKFQLGDRSPVLIDELRSTILRAYVRIYALEAIQFYASFACTFALAEEDILPGIASNLKLIARDEALHTKMSKAVIDILVKQLPDWMVNKAFEEAPAVLLDVLNREKEWGNYIFRGGVTLPKLDAERLQAYLDYIGGLAFGLIGISIPSSMNRVKEDPLLFMNDYLDTGHFQVAPQEASVDKYRVAQTVAASDEELSELGDFLL